MFFETERLIIRTPKLDDFDDLFTIRNSEFVLKYNAMEKLSEENFFKKLKEESKSDSIYNLQLKESNEVLGTIYFSEDDIRYNVNSLAIEYYLGEKYVCFGYMTEALNVLFLYYFNTINIDIITARVFLENIASRKLVEKLGFKCEGYIKKCVKGYNDIIYDDTIYSLFKEDYILSK